MWWLLLENQPGKYTQIKLMHTALFQKLSKAYERGLKYLVEKVKEDEAATTMNEKDDVDVMSKFTSDNFSNFNFPNNQKF